MKDGIGNPGATMPLQLTRQQQDVMRALQGRENERFPLSQWYLGALYALDSARNPDRFSQAAQSLRELMEKLPRVVLDSHLQTISYDFREARRKLLGRFSVDLERYSDGLVGKSIDAVLAETIREAAQYFEMNQQPSRREQVQSAFRGIDPLSDHFDSAILKSKLDTIYRLWQQLEKYAHHGRMPGGSEFDGLLGDLERVILDLLAPITAQDQLEIRSILEQSERTEADIARLFDLMSRRGANYTFFFEQAADPCWIPILEERGYFSAPPSEAVVSDGQRVAPYWWPLHYLSRMAEDAPEEVVQIVLGLPGFDNPRIQEQILIIARRLPGAESSKLAPKVLEVRREDLSFFGHLYAELLSHWVTEGETTAALELAGVLVQFDSDPFLDNKRSRYLEHGIPWDPPAVPVPRLGDWEYRRMFEKAVRPLAEKEPYAVARVLATAVEGMIRLRTQEDSRDQGSDEDLSEAWCRRLHQLDDGYEQPSNVLVATLTFACEQVFEKAPGAIAHLDELLRSHRWKVFKRLRQHLYARFPNEQTKPWIREFILVRDDYSHSTHRYEFQQMVRNACEHFGEELLTKEERVDTFDAVLVGPPKERYTRHWGHNFNEDLFELRKRYFHQKQLAPFASALFGEYADYLEELESDAERRLSDEDYLPIGDAKGGRVTFKSPRSPEEMAELVDPELLDYINQWDAEDRFETGESDDGGWVEFDIEGLSGAFKDVFRKSVLPDADRTNFWLENLEAIDRSIYVRAMVDGMAEYVKDGNFNRLEASLAACAWVLSHPDRDPASDRQGEESRRSSHWHSSRRAVGDFVDACLEREDFPPVHKEQLAKLLEMLCTQFDWGLDRGEPVFLNGDDPLTEGINNTRSRAIENLFKAGTWPNEGSQANDATLLCGILEKRFATDAEFPLTVPEYAVLGVNYVRAFNLDMSWAATHESDFFPQEDLNGWRAAFGSLLQFTNPHPRIFETLQRQFEFAVERIPLVAERNGSGASLTDRLGEHLFRYYLWGVFPLKGGDSLLRRFYGKTSSQPERWCALLRHVGHILRNTNHLDQELEDRIKSFFEWRLEQRSAEELNEFWFWLESGCLSAEWRLDAFSRILDIGQPKRVGLRSVVGTLRELLPEDTAGVVECFTKLTGKVGSDTFHIRIEIQSAREIVKAALQSPDQSVRDNGDRARDNLLRMGMSELLD